LVFYILLYCYYDNPALINEWSLKLESLSSLFSAALIVTIVVIVIFIAHQDGRSVLLQYSHWQNGEPSLTETNMCTVVNGSNEWFSLDCNQRQKYVCQS